MAVGVSVGMSVGVRVDMMVAVVAAWVATAVEVAVGLGLAVVVISAKSLPLGVIVGKNAGALLLLVGVRVSPQATKNKLRPKIPKKLQGCRKLVFIRISPRKML